MASKPRVFIGSSVEGLEIANELQTHLMYDAEVTPWNQGSFELSKTTIESLMEFLNRYDFAIFVFSPDDLAKIKSAKTKVVRDNVIFELGLFIGRIGRERTFIIAPNKPDFHIPTDLLGVTTARYDALRSDGNLNAATGPAANEIRKIIKKVGKINPDEEISESLSESGLNDEAAVLPSQNEKDIVDDSTDWFMLYLDGKYAEAIKLLDEEIEGSKTEGTEKNIAIIFRCMSKIKIKHSSGLKELRMHYEENIDNPGVVKNVIWAYSTTGHIATCMDMVNKELSKNPNDHWLLLTKSELFKKAGQEEQSLKILKQLRLQDEPVLMRLFELSVDVGNNDEAFNYIHKAYTANPNSADIIYKYAKYAQDNSKNELALYLFDKLSNEYPTSSTYITYLGNTCIDLGMPDIALKKYIKANELSETPQGWILANIGNVYKNQGLHEVAKQYLKESISINDDAYSHNRMAELIKAQEDENELYRKHLKEGKIQANVIHEIEVTPKPSPKPTPRRLPPPPPPVVNE